MSVTLGWVGGCLRRFAEKSSSDGNVPKHEAANANLSNVFQICSSAAFGLPNPPVSLKPSRSRPLPVARNESTAFAESLRAIECVSAEKSPRDSAAHVQQSQRQKSRNGRALNSE